MEEEGRKTKIKMVGLYWEWSRIDWCQEMEEKIKWQICMGHHSEGAVVKLWELCAIEEKEEEEEEREEE